MKILRWLIGSALALALVLSACEDATGPEGSGQVQILLTDAPADYLAVAEVTISEVYLKAAAEEEEEVEGEGNGGNKVVLLSSEDPPLVFDLLKLQDGNTAQLTDIENVEAGTYHQLRMVVSEATVTLKEEYEFRDGGKTMPLKVPSGMQSGIKVHLNTPLEVAEETLTTVTVDFDVSDNFVIQGNADTPAGIHGVLFTPTLKEKDRTEEDVGG